MTAGRHRIEFSSAVKVPHALEQLFIDLVIYRMLLSSTGCLRITPKFLFQHQTIFSYDQKEEREWVLRVYVFIMESNFSQKPYIHLHLPSSLQGVRIVSKALRSRKTRNEYFLASVFNKGKKFCSHITRRRGKTICSRENPL